MAAAVGRPTRREQRREETLAEIKNLAVEQVAEGGPEAVSLTAVARAMSMSPAAIYRYFESRDALLADLVVELYDSLADRLEAVPQSAGEGWFRAVATAYRQWALDNPNGYRLIFQTISGSGLDLAPERTITASSRSMTVFLAALTALAPEPRQDPGGRRTPGTKRGSTTGLVELDRQLHAWAQRSHTSGLPPSILLLGLTAWTRIHGLISLELGHHLLSTGVSAHLLYDAEVSTLITAAQTGPERK